VTQLYLQVPILVTSYDTYGLRWGYSYFLATTREVDILVIPTEKWHLDLYCGGKPVPNLSMDPVGYCIQKFGVAYRQQYAECPERLLSLLFVSCHVSLIKFDTSVQKI
jgi:hypothetical protein